MIDYILRNTRLLVLMVGILIVSALSAIQALPRAEDPALINRWATITTHNPGTKPEHMETLITEPIEMALRQLDEIKQIESVSRTGLSVINIELNDSLTDTDAVWSKVRDKIDDASRSLPVNTSQPEFNDNRSKAFTSITALIATNAAQSDLLILSRYAKELANQLRNLPGTEYVAIQGAPEEEVVVEFDLNKTASLGLDAASISALIASADSKSSAGEIFNHQYRFQIEVTPSLDTIEQVAQLPVRTLPDGQQIKVKDIASVTRQAKSPDTERALINGRPAVIVAARMQEDLRVDLWTESIHDHYQQYRQQLPQNIQLESVFEQDGYTTLRLKELINNLLIGLVLIILVLLLTLGFRSAVIVAFSLPLTSAFTLALMNITNIPINQMSVTGLIVALGIMVDNAIVMVDTIQENRKRGLRRIESATAAIVHLWLPLAGSTLTTILAFAPIFLMPGPAGEFVSAIALTVSFSLLGSYLISHTLVAGFAARFLPKKDTNPRWYHSGIHLPQLSKGFKWLIYQAVKRPILTILFVGVLPASGFWAIGQLTEQFFPPSDRDMFQVQLFMPPSSSIDGTHLVVNKASEIIQQEAGIEAVNWVVGGDFPSFYYNMVGRQRGSANYAHAMIKTDTWLTADTLIPRIQKKLDDQLPQAQVIVRKLEQGPPFNAPIELKVSGPNIETIRSVSESLRYLLATTPYVVHTRETMLPGVPAITVHIDQMESQLSTRQQTDITRDLNNALTGITGSYLIEGTEQVPIRVRLSDDNRASLQSISGFQFSTQPQSNERTQPIDAIAKLSLTPGIGSIPRRDGQRINVIEGYLETNILPQTALNLFKQRLVEADIIIPPGYTLSYGGESAERDESVNQLMSSLSIVFTLLVAVVVLSFNSFRLSLIIFMVGGQAAGLGLFAVWLFGYPFGFTVIIGLIGLAGLAINAAIVIIAELRTRPEALQGNKKEVVQAVMSCTRHITSTTITTVGGFLPLIISGGGFWPPFAITIAGGTVFTTIITFFFVPAAFTLSLRFGTLSKTLPRLATE
ncbi:efflux RND transporter permease subunit [Thaumasiovibrio sp. DFM-14]|uniref:efflux RND transporter permease subunit n=1 Tax=Thaumasiovibrio sp. DFM-14 TaxID=3384792 RepID=UPI0039A0A3D3